MNLDKRYYKPIIFIFIVTLFAGWIFMLDTFSNTISSFGHIISAPPPSKSKQISQNSLSLVEVWRLDRVELPLIKIVRNGVILARQGASGNTVSLFNVVTGDLVWETPTVSEHIWSLVTDGEERIYVGYTRYVTAYDLVTGSQIWQSVEQSKEKKGGLFVSLSKSTLEVRDPSSNKSFAVNPETGNISNVAELSDIFWMSENTSYIVNTKPLNENSCCSYELVAKNSETDQQIWTLTTLSRPLAPPILLDEIIY